MEGKPFHKVPESVIPFIPTLVKGRDSVKDNQLCVFVLLLVHGFTIMLEVFVPVGK